MTSRYTLGTLTREIVLLLVALFWALPIYVIINVALTPKGRQGSPMVPPVNATLHNLVLGWDQGDLGPALLSSALVTVTSVILIVAAASLAAYPLARVTNRWSTVTFYTFMFGLLIPYQLVMIPLYQTMRDLSLLGTPWSLVLFYVGFQMPFSIFIYTQFLRKVPIDYEEAARLDGCSPLRAFIHVVFPMLRPVTTTVVILNGIFIWTDFFAPLLYVEGSPFQTAPVALYGFVNGLDLTYWPAVFSALIIISLPALIVYFFMQRTFMQGFATGLKG
jgi:raffinose/stachyose/melibiose transport system permease protein